MCHSGSRRFVHHYVERLIGVYSVGFPSGYAYFVAFLTLSPGAAILRGMMTMRVFLWEGTAEHHRKKTQCLRFKGVLTLPRTFR